MRSLPRPLDTMLKLILWELVSFTEVEGERRGGDFVAVPVLVDHVGDAEAVVDDLAPSVAVEELGAELRRGQVPRARVGEGGVLVDGRDLLAGLEQLLEAE